MHNWSGYGTDPTWVCTTTHKLRMYHSMTQSFELVASCLPYIPEKGTVGASGDLAPLSHLALGMMGEGMMWSPKTGWAVAKDVLESHDLQPITLGPKDVRTSL